MISHVTEKFKKLLSTLPQDIRKQAKVAYCQFKSNPQHSSLQFKKVHPTLPIYSARINLDYRVLGRLENDKIIWFWIGNHTEYEKMLRKR